MSNRNGSVDISAPDFEWGEAIGGATGTDRFGNPTLIAKWTNVEVIYSKNRPGYWTVIATVVHHPDSVTRAVMTDDRMFKHVAKCYHSEDLLNWVYKSMKEYGQ